MQPRHTSRFTIRFYECDPFGHLNNATYLRLMQEAAFSASAELGYTRQRYMEMGRIWLVRETEIDYLQPVKFGEEIEVETWVEDMHRVRSIRRYDFRRPGSDQLVASARTDWVYTDLSSGLPVRIPPEVAQVYTGNGSKLPVLARSPFPEPAPLPVKPFSLLRRVEWRDLDPWGHVHNANYLAYIEDCGMQVSLAFGWDWERMQAAGFGIIARRHQIEYRQPALLGDQLEISTWVSGLRSSTATRHYLIKRLSDQKVITACHTLYVWVDLASGKPIRIPADFRVDFEENVSADTWVEQKGGR